MINILITYTGLCCIGYFLTNNNLKLEFIILLFNLKKNNYILQNDKKIHNNLYKYFLKT